VRRLFLRKPNATLCFCATKNPTLVVSKFIYFLILNKKIALASAMFLYPVAY
jgi:hypothetical protein